MRAVANTRTARIPLSKIRSHPSNVRRELIDLHELKTSMTEFGQLQPIRVHQRGTMFELLDGHRRYAAAHLAGMRTLLAEIVPARTEGRAIAEMLETALHKQDLTPAERSAAINKLLDIEGCTGAELAIRYGVSQGTISRWRHWPTTGYVPSQPSPPSPPTSRIAPADGRRRVQHRPRPVPALKVRDFADQWADRAAGAGLDAAAVAELLAELRALTAPVADQAKAGGGDRG